MKKTMLVATFLAVGAGSAGVSALSNITMKGSDTLKLFTLNVISTAVCPAAVGITYIGGGSDGGEDNMKAGAQTVAPMSKFITNKVCSTTTPGGDATAEGIAFATDGISVVASQAHLAACQTTKTATDCSASGTGAAGSGLKETGSVACAGGDPGCSSTVVGTPGTYTFGANATANNVQGWQDVLRLIYLGMPQTAGKNPGLQNNTLAPPPAAAIRDCASQTRTNLVNSWGNLFENGCEATGGSCTKLNHAFRRDLLSGTTDVFRELINAKLFPFCSARFAGDTTPVEYATTLVSTDPTVNGSPVYADAYQDFDPIRRHCDGDAGGGADLPNPVTSGGVVTQPDFPAFTAEQVCGPQNTLGLVLVMVPPQISATPAVGDLYPTKPCQKGKLGFAAAPVIPGTTQSTLCPNGDVTVGGTAALYHMDTGAIDKTSHSCLVPLASDGDFNCINSHNNFVNPVAPPFGAIPTAKRDGRIYNQHLRVTGTSGAYTSDSTIGTRANVVGNFTRIHTTRTEITGGETCPGTSADGRCCGNLDATSQIGCLVQADPCAFGFAGGEAADVVLQTSKTTPEGAFKADIAGIQAAGQCIETASYPLSRKVYINSYIGYQNVTGQELELAKCFATAGSSASQLAGFGLFQVQSNGVNGALCQEITHSLCPDVVTTNGACATNPAGIPNITTH
jgi:hypothetical protein